MRKQTKLVAVLSAAALLAIGASMTSFAAGWQKNDDGSWSYYDNDDELVTGEWKKDGAKWFYLDDDGIMLTDAWVDDDYYVGDDGAMLINAWKKTITDDDVDDPEDDGESWYYFGSKGKKTTDDKKIGGKTYYFGDEGKMEDEWYEENGNVYYLGDEDDGARKSGWLWLESPDEEGVECYDHDSDDEDDICDEEGWYYFGSDGKMSHGSDRKKINGRYYYFNAHGQMLYEWINNTKRTGTPANAQKDGEAEASAANAKDMLFMNSVEEGWRADGWYEIDGSDDTGKGDDTSWYYFKDGKAKKADMETKYELGGVSNDADEQYRKKEKIAGKYFAFDEIGQMQTGLQYIPENKGFYFFDENGYMKTGKVSSVEEDNDSFTYYFETKTGKLGKGVTGEKSGYLYWNGKRLEADDDYKMYVIEGKKYIVNKSGKLQKSDSKEYELENEGTDVSGENKFTFNSKTYEVTGGIGNIVAEEPEIELYEQVINEKLFKAEE